MSTHARLNECASALAATDVTVEYLVDGLGHPGVVRAVTSFVENSDARRAQLGRQAEHLAEATKRTATEFLLTDEQLAAETSRG